ncbi:MAG: biliverdin-producing heme oxygenase [Proteobacteria bacterium]|nr:biliverdin-producing heme oxygenase [Pseudomonadota bacterium]
MALPATDARRAPASAPDPRDALRRATAHLHAEVDASMPLARPNPSLADYRCHLALLADWVDALRALPVDAERLDDEARRVDADLAECERLLSAPHRDQSTSPPSPATAPGPFGWGVAYVIEGSRLGGQVMYRRLADALAPHPLAYLQGAGRDTGARWSAFLAELRQQLRTDDDVRAACDGAVQAFALLLACRRARERAA